MRQVVECNAVSITSGAEAPSEFVYIPEGRHKIFPKSHPKGVWVTLKPERGEIVAAAFNADLARRQGENVAPWIDFDHNNKGASAGEPKAFRYEPGKGLLCSVEWSASGKTAIEGKDYRYFSGRFDLDNEEPIGLPQRGPFGGLVNEPAFREIPAITAGEAEEPDHTPHIMSTILASCGLLSATEAALPNADELARTRVTAMNAETDAKKKRIMELEAELAELKKEKAVMAGEIQSAKSERAKTIVEAAVADGRIAPADEATKTKFIERITAGDAFAEEILSQLPAKGDGVTRTLTAGQSQKENATLESKARKLVEAGEARNIDEAIASVVANDPKAYNDYLATLA